MEHFMVHMRITLLLLLLSVCVPHVVGVTYPDVLVATLSSISLSSYALYLPVGSPAQKLPLLLDLQASTTSLSCATSATSSAGAGCTSSENSVSLYIQKTALADPLISTNVSAVDFQCCASTAAIAGVVGVAGFNTGNLSLPSQITKNAGLPRQFAYCLPSVVFFGRATTYAYLNASLGQIETFTPAARTRLYYVKNPLGSGSGSGGDAYAISLQSITVSGSGDVPTTLQKPIKLRMSTTETYTTLERSIYKAVRDRIRQAVGYGSVVKKIKAVAPFDTCFDSTPLYNGAQGSYLRSPVTWLDLEGGAKWALYPHHTFVPLDSINTNLVCLAILNAGAGRPSVLGSFQQRDTLFEFDLQHSRFAFTSLFNPYGLYTDPPSCEGLGFPIYHPQ